MFPIQGNQPDETLYVDDVFSTYLYTGNGSTQTINNGIDLAGKGGLVWHKSRSNVYSHILHDTARGFGSSILATDSTGGALSTLGAWTALSNGFSINAGFPDFGNGNSTTYVSWTFRRAPKFFDVVTYTGTGSAQTIAHSLGVAPGMVIVKRTDASGYSWIVWNRGLSTDSSLKLNTTDGEILSAAYIPTAGVTSTSFQVGYGSQVSDPGTYVAYLFAHDTSADGIIQAGSFTGDAQIPLGWEPQYLLVKPSSTTGNWQVFDSMRGWTADGGVANLTANTSNAENATTTPFRPNSTGFKPSLSVSDTYIYLAVRRPNKPPTSGTQVYNAIARTGTGAAATVTGVGFAPDLLINANRPRNIDDSTYARDRLRGYDKNMRTASTSAEATYADALTGFDVMDGFRVGTDGAGQINNSGASYINWCFRRAVGVFDVVAYTGTGLATTVAHNLGVAPELMIVKKRGANGTWVVYYGDPTDYMVLNSTQATADNIVAWNDTAPTTTVFTVGTLADVNDFAATFVAYLFATKPGISCVGSFTGNGSSQTINCGFTTGARFILIKRTDNTGDWYVWDSTRGIIAGNDPHLSLNTTAAEVTTDDSIDPDNSGFIVNQLAATNINVTSATYIFLSFA